MRRTLFLWRLVRSQNPCYSRCLLHLPALPFSNENHRIFQKFNQALSCRALSTQDPKTGIINSEFPSVPVASQSFADTLLSKIWQHSVEQPNRPAFISAEDPEDFVTYQQLYLSSYSISTFLDSVGFGRGDIACAVLPICWQFMGIFIGCAIQGGAISGANNQYTHLELERQFNDSKCKIVFCADNCLEKVINAVKNCPAVKKIVVVPTSRDCSVEPLCISDDIVPFSAVLSTKPNIRKREFDVDVERDILLMPYSSGTTGPPKGVMLTHKSFGTMMNAFNCHFDHQILYKMDPKWDWKTGYQCFILPLYHIYGIGITTNCILAGGCGILLKQFDGQIFCKTIQNYKISHVQLVPPVLLFLAKSPVISKYDLSSIKFIMTGAAPAGAELCDEVMKRLPSIKQISQGYGMTEESMASHLPVFGLQNTAAAGKLMSNLEMKKPFPNGLNEPHNSPCAAVVGASEVSNDSSGRAESIPPGPAAERSDDSRDTGSRSALGAYLENRTVSGRAQPFLGKVRCQTTALAQLSRFPCFQVQTGPDPKTGIINSEFPSVPVASQSFADTLLSKIWQHSVEQPNRPAFISAEDPEDFVTYQQLYLSSYSISTFLDSVGFGRGDIACAVLPICWQFMGIFIGCAIQGGAISGANNQYTHLELERQFNDSKCKIVFCADNCLEKVINAVKNCPAVKKIVVVPTSRDCSVEPLCISDDIVPFSAVLSTKPNIRKREFDADVERDILLMPYSSGTTGPPKGVMLTHKSFGTMMNAYNCHFDHQILYKMDPKWDWKTGYQCFILPLYHIYGIGNATNCILSGGCGILLKQFDPEIFCKTIQNYKISHVQLVPPVLLFLAKSPVISKYDLSSIKFIMTGAAPAGAELCDEASHFSVFGQQNTAAAGSKF
ncbi:AMP-binding enzyme domain-containing protein [Ditylenchus destructor]|uniref:AMP-binding enzyme domain-containing protein n=1 Tax=Ditylenchus destructor TaxID=166010 RepID=A0AAD4NCH9_9BILA|nr:AMP-binding enzyme domain-containing protein [Ditylenchus destructor]